MQHPNPDSADTAGVENSQPRNETSVMFDAGVSLFATSASSKRFMQIKLALADYPVLNTQIRELMRQELFDRSIIEPELFRSRVREMAIHSQEREGTSDEPKEIWELRLGRISDHLTDLIFSQHLSFEVFEKIVKHALEVRGIGVEDLSLSINLELAPMELVFEYARKIEALPPAERSRYNSRLEEAKAILIRTLISDQLQYIRIARKHFAIEDLAIIRSHKIGAGRIGGKAAGLLLAFRILANTVNDDVKAHLRMPESYYVGSGELYTFMSINNLVSWNNQKYKNEEQMREEYPRIVEEFRAGKLPADIQQKFCEMLATVGNKPLIVRSSSLLEDNFGTSFAGKYESIFVPNQGTLEENLQELTDAIAIVYASALNPSALLYRRSRGLQDYDERMGLLIQTVQGDEFDKYYFPHGAGVAFSHNTFRWAPKIRREDGFVRLVWGLGTRAVDRVGNDYPRLVALSHPLLRPSTEPKAIRRYSQQYIDLLDLEERRLKTLPIHTIFDTARYKPLRYVAQMDEGDYFATLRSNLIAGKTKNLVVTFDELLKRTEFSNYMRSILTHLEEGYESPVDIEFTLDFGDVVNGKPQVDITLLQCRPQSYLAPSGSPPPFVPSDLDDSQKAFSTRFVVPEGYIKRINYVVFIPPEAYFALPTNNQRHNLARYIGKLNAALKNESFIMVGPGRWGSSNPDLGVPIDYGDIYNSRSLVELTGEGVGLEPEPSLGTHFFQDLVEAHIFPLAIQLDLPETIFNRKFFYDTPNVLTEFIGADEKLQNNLRLIRVSDYSPDHFLRIVMQEELSEATAYFVSE